MNERSLFLAALEISDPAARAAYLYKECGNDAALRQRVEKLLKAHDEAGSFLEKPAAADSATGAYTPEADLNVAAMGSQTPTSPSPLFPEGRRVGDDGPGARIGPYKLLQQIGEGGMGTVYMAEQTEPVRRMVALKIIKAGMDSKEVVARFDAERQALAVMDHQNIAKVFDAGTTDTGRLYFVMELVKGIPITRYCDEHRLTPRQRLELFMPVCHALQHAHQKGIIHRDIKPSNVLVAPYDGKPVIKVIDFGIAKATGQRLTERTMFTEFGAVIGTLEYMSPEQAELNNQDIDTRSDIYSLGVLLYELLTGTTPLNRTHLKLVAFTEMLRIIREEEPPRPSNRLSSSKEALPTISAQRQTEPAKLSKLMRGDLDWIVMKSLDKDRTRRYETANGLARDIERYLTDEAVEACPPSAGYRLWKLMRRYKTPLRVAAALFLVLLTGVIVSTWLAVLALQAEEAANLARDAEQERAQELSVSLKKTEEAEQSERIRAGELAISLQKTEAAEKAERQRAQELKQTLQESERNLNHGRILLAESAWHYGASAEFANHYLELIPPQFRKWEWGYLKRKYHGGLFTIGGDFDAVWAVTFSPDGSRIAIASSKLQLLDARSGEPHLEFSGLTSTLTSIAFSADGDQLASGSADNKVQLWKVNSGKLLAELAGHTSTVYCVSFSPDARRVASGSADKTVRVWNGNSGEQPMELRGHTDEVRSIAFSPDGHLLASGSLDNTVRLWDVQSGQLAMALKGHFAQVNCVGFNYDGTRLASASVDKTVRLWDTRSGQQLLELKGHTNGVMSVAFSPDGSRIVSGSADNTIRVWNAKNGQPLAEFKGHTRLVCGVAFSPDGSRIVSGSFDGSVRVWDAEKGQTQVLLKGHTHVVKTVAFNSKGDRLVSGSIDRSVRLWDARSGQQLLEIGGNASGVSGVAFSPDGNSVLIAAANSVRLWDIRGGKQAMEFKGNYGGVSCVSFSPDGSRIVSGTGDKMLRVWGVKDGQSLLELEGHTGPVSCVAFSPDGTRIVSGSIEKTVRLWDARSGQQLLELTGHSSQVMGLAFSPDGGLIASGSLDKTVRIWDAITGHPVHVLKGHTEIVWCVAFSSDGNRIASGSSDKTVRVWAISSGQQLVELKGHADMVLGVAFSPDGKRLASASGDTTVRIWDSSFLKTTLDAEDRLRRLSLTRPDPQWHVEKQREFEKQNNPFAAAFHRSWEQHARGVLAFEAGNFHMAFAHFVAAAAMKPNPPVVGK